MSTHHDPRPAASADGGRTHAEHPADAHARPQDPSTDRPWASVTACPDGPLLVRGDVEILLADGEPAPRRRRTVALCRCGASAIKPYCDGSHKVIGFRTDDEPRTGAGTQPAEAPPSGERGEDDERRARRERGGLRSA